MHSVGLGFRPMHKLNSSVQGGEHRNMQKNTIFRMSAIHKNRGSAIKIWNLKSTCLKKVGLLTLNSVLLGLLSLSYNKKLTSCLRGKSWLQNLC